MSENMKFSILVSTLFSVPHVSCTTSKRATSFGRDYCRRRRQRRREGAAAAAAIARYGNSARIEFFY
jgi:hypothetical protein